MPLRQGDPHASSELEAYMSVLERMSNFERWRSYQECAKHLLIRYLIAQNLAQEPVSDEECRPAAEECVAENAEGVCYLFYFRGAVWDVVLSRKEGPKRILQQRPDQMDDPDLFMMDLAKPAKIRLRNADFRKK